MRTVWYAQAMEMFEPRFEEGSQAILASQIMIQ
jgi:hypothetical protein